MSVSSKAYMPQLDTVRAVAIVLVIVSHWVPSSRSLPLGHLGVQLFFVLSGFLITSILLNARGQVEQAGCHWSVTLRSFYARRALRIVPVFYATLLVTFVAGVPAVVESIQWHLAYLSNVHFMERGRWHGPVSHFWTLAVEEQFYLVWPLLMLCTGRRYLAAVIAFCIAVGPTSRWLLETVIGLNEVQIAVNPLASLDSLGLGALAGYLRTGCGDDPRRLATMRNAALCIGSMAIVATAAGTSAYGSNQPPLVGHALRALQPLVLLMIVVVAADGLGGPWRRVLEARPLLYVGKISYGIYVIHNFIPLALAPLNRKLELDSSTATGSVAILSIQCVVLLLTAAASWHFFENPINRQKARFLYVPRPLAKGRVDQSLLSAAPVSSASTTRCGSAESAT
jgi:peptidoglycan/LPS O-acetylase OafA/YrhL